MRLQTAKQCMTYIQMSTVDATVNRMTAV